MNDRIWEHARTIRPIDITAMIDIVFLLLTFFILTSRIVTQPAIELDLPDAVTAVTSRVEVPTIYVARDGVLYWEDEELSAFGEFRRRLYEYQDTTESRRLQIMGDEGVPYGTVVRVMDTCRSYGFTDLILAMEKPR